MEDKDLEAGKNFARTYNLNLPSGVYILTIEDNQGKHDTKLMVK